MRNIYAALAILGFCSLSAAEVDTAVSIGDVACTADAPDKGVKIERHARSLKTDCAMDIEAAAARMAGGGVAVDVRPAANFEAFRINGAINTPVHTLRGMGFLQQKRLLLVGDGKDEKELYASCAELSAQGFADVKVLRGGMAAWVSSGKDVVGAKPESVATAQLSTAELSREIGFADNLLVTTLSADALPALLRGRVLTVGNAKPAALKSLWAEKRTASKSAGSIILLLGEAGAPPKMLEAMRQLLPVPVMFYTQPMAEFEAYAASQKVMWAAEARGPKSPPCRN